MLALLLSSWMILPAYPLNPVQQDTIATANLHLSVGYRGSSNIVSAGPDVTAMYELMVWHPIVVRVSAGYGFGTMISRLHPAGKIHSGTIAIEGLYYRGSKHMTGYIGFGVIYTTWHLIMEHSTVDSLWREHSISNVSIQNTPGFRLIMGLRRDVKYSLELSITEVRPRFLYTSHFSSSEFAEEREQVRLNDYRIMVGYLIEL